MTQGAANPDESATASQPRAIDRDLYCLQCGYNLRGLSGDPVRCPECGYWNPVEVAEIPAETIARQLRRMETAPAVCVGCTLAFGFGAFLTCLAQNDPCFGTAASITIALAATCWAIMLRRFRNSCLRKPGWLAALLKYHLFGVTMMVTAIPAGPPAVWGLITAAEKIGLSGPDSALAVGAVGTMAYIVAAVVWVRWLYFCAKGAIQPLQREVAATLARDEVRRRMARGRRPRLFG